MSCFYKNEQLDAKLEPAGFIEMLSWYIAKYIYTELSKLKESIQLMLDLAFLMASSKGSWNGRLFSYK